MARDSSAQFDAHAVPGVNRAFYPLAWSVIYLYYRLSGWKVYGRENVPRRGAVIFATNHVSLMDPPAVNLALPRIPRTMAKAELFKGPAGWIIRALGGFPVHRGTPDRTAIRTALNVLKADIALSVFPEGTRSPDGELGQAETGFSYIVHAAKVPVVPIYLQGNEKTLSPQHPGFRLASNQVWIGEPLHFHDEWAQKSNREMLTAIGERVMAAIAELRAAARENDRDAS